MHLVVVLVQWDQVHYGIYWSSHHWLSWIGPTIAAFNWAQGIWCSSLSVLLCKIRYCTFVIGSATYLVHFYCNSVDGTELIRLFYYATLFWWAMYQCTVNVWSHMFGQDTVDHIDSTTSVFQIDHLKSKMLIVEGHYTHYADTGIGSHSQANHPSTPHFHPLYTIFITWQQTHE